ncbi:sporulation-delaying protein SdpB family protein [Streptomyces sp. SM14]|uniref:sporulation-delaying protein SdpB family protein n=1 Tax=Streptomyces sp. SM14 TaxID=1736045 RepID=UPI000CD4D655|nr:sporulation-delaying protein SdpB family protein [Streptomyces sp. SM14]
MLTRVPQPWTNVYGLARTLVALGTAGTLAFSATSTLFRPVAMLGDYPLCEGLSRAGVFCVVPGGQLTLARWLCVAALLVVASGWRPRWTAPAHAWIGFSVFSGIAISDGGDQIAMILALLLAVPALGDPRRWHWQRLPDGVEDRRRSWALAGSGALVLLRVQMCFLYFQACVAKLPHSEWADGTALWYWGTSDTFGPPGPLRPLVEPMLALPVGVAVLTWLPLFVEIALAACLLVRQRLRYWLLAAGVGFHLSIAVMMGLWSFAFAMWGGLVLLCLPLGAHLSPRRRAGADARAEDGTEGDAGDGTEGDAGAERGDGPADSSEDGAAAGRAPVVPVPVASPGDAGRVVRI